MLKKGVVQVIDKVIESVEFANMIEGVQKACEALGLEKWKWLASRSTISSEPEAPNPSRVSKRDEEVDISFRPLLRWIS